MRSSITVLKVDGKQSEMISRRSRSRGYPRSTACQLYSTMLRPDPDDAAEHDFATVCRRDLAHSHAQSYGFCSVRYAIGSDMAFLLSSSGDADEVDLEADAFLLKRRFAVERRSTQNRRGPGIHR